MQKQMIRTIIFDLDGTLFQTEGLALPAFRDTMIRLRAEGLYDGPEPTDALLLSMFGKTVDQIWTELLPGASSAAVAKADEYMLYYELTRLHQGDGAPYPGVVDTLRALQEYGYRLCIASNGAEGYVSGVAAYYFAGFFAGVYSAGKYGTRSKVDLVRRILADEPDGAAAMVGDRSSDVEAGKANGLLTIGCHYGFGNLDELAGADSIVTDFTQLRELFLA